MTAHHAPQDPSMWLAAVCMICLTVCAVAIIAAMYLLTSR